MIMDEVNEFTPIKKFDIYDFRQTQSNTYCKSLMFDVLATEEKSDHILATIMIGNSKKNVQMYKYDFKGRFWGDSTSSGLDLFNKVYDQKGNDITIKYLKEVRNISNN